MKMWNKAVLLMLSLVLSGAALAHSEHGNPQYGGVFAEAGTFQAELVAKPTVITLYLTEHEKKLSSQGAKAKLVVLTGAEKSEVNLQPAGDNKLEAKGSFKLGSASKVIATVTLAGKAPQNLRFVLP